ncbi:hypothetical protein CPB83DRAFT_602958 [Crepidotus variabilis]|uniref:Uncharacterized protein n=1 Tax=Crepidotus variabilis TaxID=179855 RepID=A0A9P6JKW1_9AGAR|nr:hypothetical protein CPB83DRAFT_602958 [Crepidotus variabilis]
MPKSSSDIVANSCDFIMTEEAFPNSEQLLRQAFAAEDPVPQLLQLLKENPTFLAARDLTTGYICAIHDNPHRAYSIASSFAKLCNSPDAPLIESQPLRSLVDDELMEGYFQLRDHHSNPKESDIYEPENTFLLESLVAGVSVKHGWNSSNASYVCLQDGLNAPAGPAMYKSQVLVVGACIQLLLSGSIFVGEIAGSYRKTPEEIAGKLKNHKAKGTVVNSRAIQVLELAIAHAEQGLKPENDREDVWPCLFPGKC